MSVRTAPSPFVGRERELSMLVSRLTTARQDQSGLVLVGGEPGIGKSRLVSEFAEQARTAGWQVLTGRAYQAEGMPPYLPFIEAILEFLHTSAPDHLDALLGPGVPDVARLVPEVERYLTEAPTRHLLSPEAERYRLFVSLSEFLLNIARMQPDAGLLLVLEDLHWTDSSTLLLLHHLARRLPGAPLLVVGTYRTTEIDSAHPLTAVLADLRREGLEERLPLGSLTIPNVAVLISELTARPIAPEVVTAVYQKTEGNPFFVGEVVHHLLTEGHDLTDRNTAVDQWGIPRGVREVIGRRLNRLGARTNQLLQAAAVQGDGLAPDLLAALTELDTDALADALDEAVSAGMLREVRDGYGFTHALIRETLYDAMSLPRRQRLHLRSAEAIETRPTRSLTRSLATLARHYRLAGTAATIDKARDYTLRAAAAAHAVFAWEEEVAHLKTALSLVAEDDLPRRCDLFLAIGEALRAAGQPLQALEEAAPAAYSLAEALGDSARAIRACTIATQALLAYGSGAIAGARRFCEWADRADRWARPDTPERARADLLQLYALFGSAQYRAAEALIPRLLAHIRERGTPAEQCEVVAQILALNPSPANVATFERLADEYGGEPGNGVSVNLAGWLLFYAGWIHLDSGARGRTESAWRQLADLAERTGEPVVGFFSLRAELIRSLLAGDLAGAVARGNEVSRRAHEHGSPVLAWFHSSNLVYRALLLQGQAAEALNRAAIPAEARALGLAAAAPSLCLPEALCLAHAGRHGEARQGVRGWVIDRHLGAVDAGTPASALVQFLEAAVLTGDREIVALLAERLADVAFLGVGMTALTCIARHLGAAAALLGRPDAAYRYYQQALEVTGRIGFRPENALTRLQLAELLLTQGTDQQAEAGEHLAIAVREFEAMGMPPALEQAQRLRAWVGEGFSTGRLPTPVYPDRLTEREVEILRLLAAGQSNREISATLVLSVRTVERHIENVYLKIGVHNRTRATLYAQEHHLL